jgi:hypothetical protein
MNAPSMTVAEVYGTYLAHRGGVSVSTAADGEAAIQIRRLVAEKDGSPPPRKTPPIRPVCSKAIVTRDGARATRPQATEPAAPRPALVDIVRQWRRQS